MRREPEPRRFEAIDHAIGEVDVRYAANVSEPGDFLGRLWRVVDKAPREIEGGFAYAIRDRANDRVFVASFVAWNGATYGCSDEHGAATVQAFDQLLRAAPPVDCAWAYTTIRNGRAERVAVGARDGRAFERDLPEPSYSSASTHAECARLAAEIGGAYGPELGWDSAFQRIKVPSFVLWRGTVLERCVGLGLSDAGRPVLRCDGAESDVPGDPILIDEVALDDEIAEQLAPDARLWLDAHHAWRIRTRAE